jgi:hypothetical protein
MIKIFQDNGRVIIVIENDDNIDMQKFTEEIVKKTMSLSIPVIKEEIVGLEPIEPQPEDIDEIISSSKEITPEQEKEIIEKQILEDLNNEQNSEIVESKTDLPDGVTEKDLIDDNYKYTGQLPMTVIMNNKTLNEKDSKCVELYCVCNSINNKKLRKIMIQDLKTYLATRFNDLSESKVDTLSRQEIIDTLCIYEPLSKKAIQSILEQAGYFELNSFLQEVDEINIKAAYYTIIKGILDRLKL